MCFFSVESGIKKERSERKRQEAHPGLLDPLTAPLSQHFERAVN